MRLSEILAGTKTEIPFDIEITSLADRLSEISEGCLFFCIDGKNFNATSHAEEIKKRGAAAVISEKPIKTDIPNIVVEDIRKTEAYAAANFFGTNKTGIKFIGITGTNGKTTVAEMIFSCLRANGKKTALTGTVNNRINEKTFESEYTTPTPILFHRFISKAAEEGCEYCVSEVSSHALKQNRVDGITFELGIFTNITPEHSDYHPTFDDYKQMKLRLFELSKKTLANLDCKEGEPFFTFPGVRTFSLEDKNADYFCKNAVFSKILGDENNISAEFETENGEFPVSLSVIGKHNLSNALAAFAASDILGLSHEKTVLALASFTGAEGRCEPVKNDLGINILIDYAHTSDAVLNIIKTARSFTSGNIIFVFGCGGNRDSEKRPEMGKIASENADFVIVTSDNPRNEDPENIIKDILAGVNSENYEVEINRYRAIRKAVLLAKKGDTVLISGKGHEKKQIVSNRIAKISDREIVLDILKESDYED